MAVREIQRSTGQSKVGHLGRSPSVRGKRTEVVKINTYSDDRMVGVHVQDTTPPDAAIKHTIITLTPWAALELVKGILENVNEHFVYGDDELKAIYEAKCKAASDDAEAVVAAVLERHQPAGKLVDAPAEGNLPRGVVEEHTPPVAAGVVCTCPADFCPAHGKLNKSELRQGRKVRE